MAKVIAIKEVVVAKKNKAVEIEQEVEVTQQIIVILLLLEKEIYYQFLNKTGANIKR